VPPSYKSTALDPTLVIPQQQRGTGVSRSSPPTRPAPFLRKVLAVPKDPKKVVNLDDAWKNIRLEQDEKVADKFREDMLVARCWEIWRQGFIWITVSACM
jgi:protein SFI1